LFITPCGIFSTCASYFARASRDQGRPWLAVVPLADAVTLPACSGPQNMIFVNAFHGGLLGDAPVRQMIEAFLAHGTLSSASPLEQQLRRAATLIAGAATAWRMPDLRPACQAQPGSGRPDHPLRYGP
jgi:hypothetical protein